MDDFIVHEDVRLVVFVLWECDIFVMPVDLCSHRSTIGCHWSLEKDAWHAFDHA